MYKKLLWFFAFLFLNLSFLLSPSLADDIFVINSDNDALESINTTSGSSSDIETLNFYSQGQVAFDQINNNAYI